MKIGFINKSYTPGIIYLNEHDLQVTCIMDIKKPRTILRLFITLIKNIIHTDFYIYCRTIKDEVLGHPL